VNLQNARCNNKDNIKGVGLDVKVKKSKAYVNFSQRIIKEE
jgi:uncharacterized surface protein with fasciclin (FAS1) repeats